MKYLFIIAATFLSVAAFSQTVHCCRSSDCVTILAEESSTLTANNFEFSYGNGATRTANNYNGAAIALKDGFISSFGVSMEVSGTVTTRISITLNSLVVYEMEISGNTNNKVDDVYISFNKGDIIDFKTKTAGGASSVVCSVLACYYK